MVHGVVTETAIIRIPCRNAFCNGKEAATKKTKAVEKVRRNNCLPIVLVGRRHARVSAC